MQYANRYLGFLKNRKIELIVLYNDPQANLSEFEGRIIHWNDFLKEG